MRWIHNPDRVLQLPAVMHAPDAFPDKPPNVLGGVFRGVRSADPMRSLSLNTRAHSRAVRWRFSDTLSIVALPTRTFGSDLPGPSLSHSLSLSLFPGPSLSLSLSIQVPRRVPGATSLGIDPRNAVLNFDRVVETSLRDVGTLESSNRWISRNSLHRGQIGERGKTREIELRVLTTIHANRFLPLDVGRSCLSRDDVTLSGRTMERDRDARLRSQRRHTPLQQVSMCGVFCRARISAESCLRVGRWRRVFRRVSDEGGSESDLRHF